MKMRPFPVDRLGFQIPKIGAGQFSDGLRRPDAIAARRTNESLEAHVCSQTNDVRSKWSK